MAQLVLLPGTALRPGSDLVPSYRLLRPDWSWFVAVGWVAMAALAASYVARNGRNLPMQDEWEFVAPVLGLTSGWDWAFERHYEHRYVLGRLLYLGLHRVTGNWYPAGMVVSLFFLAGSAALLVRLARRMRGGRKSC